MEAFSASRFEAWADQLPEDPSPAPGSAHGHQSPPAPDRVSAPPSPSSPVPEEDGLRSREAPGEDPLGSSSSARAGDGEPVLLGDATSLDGAANGGLSQTGTLSSEQGRGDTWDRGETEERTEAGESRETGERGENEWPIPGEGSGQGVETGQQENSGLGEEIGHRREDSTWHEGLQEAPRRNPSAAQGAVPGPEACNHDQDQAGPPRDTEGQGQDKEDGSDTTPVPAEGAGPAPSSASLERFANGEEKVERREGKDHPSLEQEVSALEKEVLGLGRRLLVASLAEEDRLSEGETQQFQHRIDELQGQVLMNESASRKMLEQHNCVAEHHKYLLKEISLLESINAQCPSALQNSRTCDALQNSILNLAKGISELVERVDAKIEAKKLELQTAGSKGR